MQLTDSQEAAAQTVLRAHESRRPLIIIDGQAGTGKTTLISSLKQRLGDIPIYAPTNAAARRLQIKGIPSASTFYRGEFVSRTEYAKRFRELDDALQDALAERPQDADKISAARARRDEFKGQKTKLAFTHVGEFQIPTEGSMYDKWQRSQSSIVIIDESSMVTTNYVDAMSRDGRLVVLVGDEFQLPPVQGRNIYVEYEPTISLSHVHRHQGKILDLAQTIRETHEFDLNPFKRKSVDGETLGRLIQSGEAMIIAWRNDTVDLWNERIRSKLNFTDDDPMPGERLISRSNAGDLLNNEIVTVVTTDPEFVVENEFGQRIVVEDFQMVPSKVPDDTNSQGANLFSFGYAITAHRSQGNEWPHVVVLDQRAGMRRVMGERDTRRWLYTAVTRAQKTLTVL